MPVTSDPIHRHPIARVLPAALALVTAALVAVSVTGTAAAKATPCAERIIKDWYDNGRIDRIYPLHCYKQAIKAIPQDIRLYADAQDVIQRAMQAALRGKLDSGGPDPTPGNSQDRGVEGGGGGSGDGGGTQASGTTGSSPSSMPVALLVLGGMSLALLAAGGLGYVARRRQAAEVEAEDDAPSDDDQQV